MSVDKSKRGAWESEEKLISLYKRLRLATVEVEQLIEELDAQDTIKKYKGSFENFNSQDLHRLDKSVTVMKVGYKMVKKILKRHGFKGLKAEAMREESAKTNES